MSGDIKLSQGAKNARAVYLTLMSLNQGMRTRQDKALAIAEAIDYIMTSLGKPGASVSDRAKYRREKRIFSWWGTAEAGVLANVATHNINAVALAAMQVVFLRHSHAHAAKCFGVSVYQLKNYLALLRTAARFAEGHNAMAYAHDSRSIVGQRDTNR